MRQILQKNGLKDTPQFDVNSIADYSQMKDKLSMEVVSAEKNAEMLGTIPHERWRTWLLSIV